MSDEVLVLRDHSHPCEHGHEFTHYEDGGVVHGFACPGGRVVRLRRKDRIDARLTGYDPDTDEYTIMSHVNLWEEVPDE